jgi:hypothetical protein
MSAPDRMPPDRTLDPLERALSELPRERAGEGFTARVVARAAEAEPERGGWSRSAVAAAAALVLLSGATAWRLERAQRLESYRGEVQDLQSEKPPVVYLGTNDKVDYYIDLAELQRLQAAAKAAAKSQKQRTGDTI